VGTLLLTATGVLTEIQSALNAIWKAAPSMGLLELVRARLLSLGLIGRDEPDVDDWHAVLLHLHDQLSAIVTGLLAC
jgi:hypothetical protein